MEAFYLHLLPLIGQCLLHRMVIPLCVQAMLPVVSKAATGEA